MEFIFTVIKPDTLPKIILCFFVLMIISLKNIKLTSNLKIGLVYLATYLMILLEWVEPFPGLFLSLISSFLVLEMIIRDENKTNLFNFWRKIIDCIYKLVVEYYFLIYLLTIIIMMLFGYDTFVIKIITSILVAYSFYCITRMKFETTSIQEMIDKLKIDKIYNIPIKEMESKFLILINQEDKSFFRRPSKSHSFLSWKILKNIKNYVTFESFLHPFKTSTMILSRGYGTIEMQLIRNIGVKHGYEQCRVRRKIFEVLYSSLIFNSVLKQNMELKNNLIRYKYWILWSYINNVPVKIKNEYFPESENTTSKQIFGKEFQNLSREEFFIWCLGLKFFDDIGIQTITINIKSARDLQIGEAIKVLEKIKH